MANYKYHCLEHEFRMDLNDIQHRESKTSRQVSANWNERVGHREGNIGSATERASERECERLEERKRDRQRDRIGFTLGFTAEYISDPFESVPM